LVHLQH